MRSHSVTCHPAEVTFPPLPQLKLVLDLATPEGCKAELTWVVVIEACPLNKTNLRSLDFSVNRLFIKLFNTSDIQIITECQLIFGFKLPSAVIDDTRCSAIAERPRCRVRYSFRQK